MAKDIDLNPPFESLPEGEFIPVVLDQTTLKLYWMAPEKNIRNGVHSLIVKKLTGQNYEEIQSTAESKRFMVGGFIKTDGNVLNFHGRNSFNSTTYNVHVNQNKYIGILEDGGRIKLLNYISAEFPNAVFRANTKIFEASNGRYTREQQDKLAETFAYGWQKEVESYNSPKTKESALKFIIMKRYALACKGLLK